MSKVKTMEEMPLSKIHFKIFAYTSGSTFVDGYVLGIIAVALSVMQPYFDMSSIVTGLIGAATLAGMFVGGSFGGFLTDLVGRKKMFILNMLILAILSILQFFVQDPMQLFMLRFFIGFALGADYPISGALMTEFSPKKHRGILLGGINGLWFIGYAVSFLAGYFMLSIGDESWRWMLSSSVVPVVLLLIARMNMPESPRWLAKQGREKEANAIVKEIFGEHVIISDENETTEKTTFLDIFRNGYGKWVIFVSVFWSIQVMTTFSIGTYIPEILGQFGVNDGSQEYLGSAVINILYLAGLLPILYLVEKYGRRPTLIWPLLVTSITLLTLGATSGLNIPFALVLVLFVIYGTFNTGMGAHQWIYPYELFPTHIRATAGGFTTGISRIASAISTFVFPLILGNFGLANTLYMSGALLFIGFLVAIFMAPETKNMSISQASSINSGSLQKDSFTQSKKVK